MALDSPVAVTMLSDQGFQSGKRRLDHTGICDCVPAKEIVQAPGFVELSWWHTYIINV